MLIVEAVIFLSLMKQLAHLQENSPCGTYPVPVTSQVFPPLQSFVTVILFCVIVPVLSEQITEAQPSVSTAGSFRTIALFLIIRCTPNDNATVTIAGNPSGIAATARETPAKNMV